MKKMRRIILFVFVYITLGVSNIMIRVLKFKKLVQLITNSDLVEEVELTNRKRRRIVVIKDSIESMCRYTPWRSKCFEQAVTCMICMRLLKLPMTISFGVKKTESNELLGHAWTSINGLLVTGSHLRNEYTEVYSRSRTY